jgi:ApaG protein
MDNNSCDIRIQVATTYVDEQSEPESDRYVFAYTITICNDGNVPARLISRHWVITDANGKVQEVSGDGVVGELGAMQGLYRMEADNGVNFDAPIAPFTLAVPGVLH